MRRPVALESLLQLESELWREGVGGKWYEYLPGGGVEWNVSGMGVDGAGRGEMGSDGAGWDGIRYMWAMDDHTGAQLFEQLGSCEGIQCSMGRSESGQSVSGTKDEKGMMVRLSTICLQTRPH